MRHAATGESMPPESRHADASAGADRQPAGAALLAEGVERLASVSASTWMVSSGLVEVHRPAARFLDASADLALDLRRGQRKPLVGPPRRHAERRRIRRVRDPSGSPRQSRRRRAARGRRARSCATPNTVAMRSRTRLPRRRRARAPSRSAPSAPRTSFTSRSRVASRRLRTSRAMNHGRFFPLSAISW